MVKQPVVICSGGRRCNAVKCHTMEDSESASEDDGVRGAFDSQEQRVRGASPDPVGIEARIMAASLARHLFGEPQRVSVGRFRIREPLGRGGMGIVYAAEDPVLERRVAVKLLRLERHGPREAAQRMIREGRAMAQLDHPGVLRVFEVGRSGDRVYVVMELATGGTLDAWLGRERRHVDEVLDRLLEAGLGLEAAHERGLVHRDFKPQNVFIRSDGSACVGDFSLVRGVELGETVAEPLADAGTSSPTAVPGADDPGAVTSAFGGTPGYMSPEQLAGGPIDARADQYAFCVTLWEALLAAGPKLAGARAAEQREAGVVPKAHAGAAVPRPLRSLLERGLAADPDERFEDMGQLLDRLRAYRTRRRRWRRRTTGGLAILGVGAELVLASGGISVGAPVCSGAASRVGDVWNEAGAMEVRRSFGGTAIEGAEHAADRVVARLDDYATAWATEYRERCKDTRQRGLRSEYQFSSAAVCLSDQLLAMEAVVDRLTTADAATVEHALPSVFSLGDPRRCGDLGWLRGRAKQAAAPTEQLARVQRLGAELHRIRAALWTGHGESALPWAQAVATRAARLDHSPLRADATYVLGSIERRLRRAESAAEHFEQSYFAAALIDDQHRACAAAAELVDVVGVWLSDRPRGQTWAKLARVAHARGPTRACAVRLQHSTANFLNEQARYDEALAALEDAFAEAEAEDDGDARHYLRIRLLLLRAQAELGLARAEAAEASTRLAIDEATALFGPNHPEVAAVRILLGSALGGGGRLEEARTEFERALAVFEATIAASDPRIAQTLGNLALTLDIATEYQRARALLLRARAIYEQHPTLQRMGFILGSLGNAAFEHGDYVAARDYYVEAVEEFVEVHGNEHPRTARARSNLGSALQELGLFPDAKHQYEQSLDGLAASVGKDHDEYTRVSFEYTQFLQRAGMADEADRVRAHGR
ncbi:MAG: serine/threonine-protein kinase [Deltaproteobacteria bacterium]|nr:serine/threonine-protein kinase [Deltaproteobacteria bacterium]